MIAEKTQWPAKQQPHRPDLPQHDLGRGDGQSPQVLDGDMPRVADKRAPASTMDSMVDVVVISTAAIPDLICSAPD
jgi:hypothetical protein